MPLQIKYLHLRLRPPEISFLSLCRAGSVPKTSEALSLGNFFFYFRDLIPQVIYFPNLTQQIFAQTLILQRVYVAPDA
jgi:hypothetical protein